MNINKYSKALSWITRPKSTETATLENFNPEELRTPYRGAGLVDHGSRVGFDKGGSAQILEYLESLNLPKGTQIDMKDVMKYAKDNKINITNDAISVNIYNTDRKIGGEGPYKDSYVLKEDTRSRWNAIKDKVKVKHKIFDAKNPGPVFEQLDVMLADKTKYPTHKSILRALGYTVQESKEAGRSGLKPILEAYAKDRKVTIPVDRFKIAKYKGTNIAAGIISDYKTGNFTIADLARKYFPEKIGKQYNNARIQINDILRDAGVREPSEFRNWSGEITSEKKSKTTARENIALAEAKAGAETTAQASKVHENIKKLNEPYKTMSVADIAKDENLLNRLRLRINKQTGEVTFDGYTKEHPVRGKVFSDLELAAHAKNKSLTNELFTYDHISGKALRKQNVGYPINLQGVTYMENSQLSNGRTYLQNNPKGNWKPIDNYLNSQNLTIRGKEYARTYGYQKAIEYIPERGTNTIVEAGGKKIKLPILKSEVIPGSSAALQKMPGYLRSIAQSYKTTGLVPTLFSKVLPPVGIALGTYFSQQAYKEGRPAIEVAAEFFGAGKVPYKIKEYLSMTKEEKAAEHRRAQQNMAESGLQDPRVRGGGKFKPDFRLEGDEALLEEGQRRFKEEKYDPFVEKKKKERAGILQFFTPQEFDPNV